MSSEIDVVYITGLGHSGSTLLNLILGSNSKLHSTGESINFYEQREVSKEQECSCGNKYAECDFWSKIERDFSNKNISCKREYVERVLHLGSDFGGDKKIIVDSSKNMDALKEIIKIKNLNLKVIFLIKDVRSWSYSNRRKAKIKGSYHFFKHSYINLFRRWFNENKNIEQFLNRNELSYFIVTYEDMCLNSAVTIKNLCDYINIEYDDNMLSPDRTLQHIINGNRMRLSDRKNINIVYDKSWFFDSNWILPSFIMKRVMLFNDKVHNPNKL